MPVYDYACRNCGHRVEVLHGVNDPGPTACERCGGSMRKLLSAPAIVFKGSGWARKDRAARPAKAGASADKGDGSESSAGSEAPTKDVDAASPAKPAEKAGTSRSTKRSSTTAATD